MCEVAGLLCHCGGIRSRVAEFSVQWVDRGQGYRGNEGLAPYVRYAAGGAGAGQPGVTRTMGRVVTSAVESCDVYTALV